MSGQGNEIVLPAMRASLTPHALPFLTSLPVMAFLRAPRNRPKAMSSATDQGKSSNAPHQKAVHVILLSSEVAVQGLSSLLADVPDALPLMMARSISCSLVPGPYLLPLHRPLPPCCVGGTIYAATDESFWSTTRANHLVSFALSEGGPQSPMFKRSYGTFAKGVRLIGIAGFDPSQIRHVRYSGQSGKAG